MDVFYWPGGPTPAFAQSVAALGVFDGVHVGHQCILKAVVREARVRSASAVVVTLDRHPHNVLGGSPQRCITSMAHRLRLFAEMGLDACIVLVFSDSVAAMPAEEFARRVLRDNLGARLLVAGPDCRFGRCARGNVQMLQQMEGELGLETQVVEPVRVDGELVSSTAIRQAIEVADLEKAERFLGRPFSLLGTVVSGAGRGTRLGFPTANLDVHNELLPRHGVYATLLLGGAKCYPSATSVGTQQTFRQEEGARTVVEVHVIGDCPDLRGADVEVRFVKCLREQRRYGSAEALKEQMKLDVAAAMSALRGGHLPS